VTPTLTSETVHEALSCLYSPAELGTGALADALLAQTDDSTDAVTRAQRVRDLILDCLEALRPADGPASTASASRAFECLTHRYVSGMTVDEVAYELHLSPRQVYRDIRWGEEMLTTLLQSRLEPASEPARIRDSLSLELESVSLSREPVDLAQATLSARSAVGKLAARLGTEVQYSGPIADVWTSTTPGLLRSLLAEILSTLVRAGGPVRLTLQADESRTALVFLVPVGLEAVCAALEEHATPLLRALQLAHNCCPAEGGTRLEITFPRASDQVVLIVEDNPGARALYARYLEGTEWSPLAAERPQAIPALAAERSAAAVILDIMMPETDGWSVLQALRMDPQTSTIPVIVCSVLNDPELASALGATNYLTKPVSRSQLLGALRRAQPAGSRF